jgi:Family of unknown function (DUF6361)
MSCRRSLRIFAATLCLATTNQFEGMTLKLTMTSFTWLDYSEHERRQAMEVIDLFSEDETRDELGLGTIRDGFADLLFPGTSTIQTRARYFLFVPWVFLKLEQKKIASRQMSDFARTLQGRLRDALIYGGEEIGVIGYRAGLHVQRLPASVYWYGLRRWGILQFDGTEDDYRRYLDSFYTRQNAAVTADGGETSDVPPSNWDVHMPRPPEDWLSDVTFALVRGESEYLVQRISANAPHSLLAHLLSTGQVIAEEQRFPWDVPYKESLPFPLERQLLHARNFSEVMHGAALLYNLLLAEQKQGGEFVAHYRDQLQMWWDVLQGRRDELETWDRASFWRLMMDCETRVRGVTRRFVDDWMNLTLAAPSLSAITDSLAARRAVTDQEHAVKPGRSRIGNPRTTENWEGSSGSAQLNYRWNRLVRAIVNDILEPILAEDDSNA